MEVASFTIDHDRMVRGVFVSRKDRVGAEVVTTFDIRLIVPNTPPYLEIAAMHTMEHLLAVYFRGHSGDFAEKVLYVGPMGCRTGMYLLLKGDLESADIIENVRDAFKFMADFEGPVPATTSKECGNYLEHDLDGAKKESKKFYDEVLTQMKEENMVYPQ